MGYLTNVGKNHDWEWFIYTTYSNGDGLGGSFSYCFYPRLRQIAAVRIYAARIIIGDI